MRRLCTALAATALLATTTLAASSGTSATAAPAPADARPSGHGKPAKVSAYVAMGDSYSATGIAPLDPGPAGSECGRSDATYSHLIAARLGVTKFRDVACGGADTSNYFHPQYADTPAQLTALRKRTQLVTMTIGGNDENVFSGLVTSCAIASAAERQRTGSISGAPCKALYGDSFRTKVEEETFPNVLHALRSVRKRAPRAMVAILGYPQILPGTGLPGCYGNVPISMGDVPYLDRTQRTLNHVIERAARQTGVLFVDMAKASRGHDACQPVGTRWIEPLIGAVSTTLHPNVIGHQAMAERALKRLGL
jgi:lysophospholipase L1-like esterase